jgi:hypothetical protein
VSDPTESLISASLRRDPLLMAYFVCPDDQLKPEEKDTYAVLALYALLKNETGKKKIPTVIAFAKKLGFNIYDEDNNTYHLPKLIDIKEKLNSEIKDSDYFILAERKTAQDKLYPVIYRPIDRFREWRKELPNMTSVDELTRMIESDGFSYNNLSSKTGIPAKEKEEMTSQLATFLSEIAVKLDVIITKKDDDGKEPSKDKKTSEQEIEKFTAILKKKEEDKKTAEDKRDTAYTSYGTEKLNQHLAGINTWHKKVEEYSATITSTTKDLETEEKKLAGLNKKLNNSLLNPQDEKDAFGYIKTCLPILSGVTSEAKDILERLINKCVGRMMK